MKMVVTTSEISTHRRKDNTSGITVEHWPGRLAWKMGRDFFWPKIIQATWFTYNDRDRESHFGSRFRKKNRRVRRFDNWGSFVRDALVFGFILIRTIDSTYSVMPSDTFWYSDLWLWSSVRIYYPSLYETLDTHDDSICASLIISKYLCSFRIW